MISLSQGKKIVLVLVLVLYAFAVSYNICFQPATALRTLIIAEGL